MRLLTVRGVCNPCYTTLSRRKELDQYPLQAKLKVRHSTAVRMCEARVAGALHCDSVAYLDGLCRGHYSIKDKVVRLPDA
jgi:hypothetical protein